MSWGSSLRHRFEYGAFRVVEGICRVLPEVLADRAGAAIGWVVARVAPPRWGVVSSQLELAFPEAGRDWRRRVARRSYVHLGAEMVAMFRLARIGSRKLRSRARVTGLEVMEEAVGRGRGVVLVSGHVGNWELGAAALCARGFAMDAVVARQRNPLFDRYLTRSRERFGFKVVPRGEARRRLLASLRAGRVVGILGDQDARQSGVFVDFFGRPASTARGAAVLALRTDALMVTEFSIRRPGWRPAYDVRIETLEVERSGNLADDVVSLTQAFTVRLEDLIREHPAQYFWLHRRWKTAPPPRVGGLGGRPSRHPGSGLSTRGTGTTGSPPEQPRNHDST